MTELWCWVCSFPMNLNSHVDLGGGGVVGVLSLEQNALTKLHTTCLMNCRSGQSEPAGEVLSNHGLLD